MLDPQRNGLSSASTGIDQGIATGDNVFLCAEQSIESCSNAGTGAECIDRSRFGDIANLQMPDVPGVVLGRSILKCQGSAGVGDVTAAVMIIDHLGDRTGSVRLGNAQVTGDGKRRVISGSNGQLITNNTDRHFRTEAQAGKLALQRALDVFRQALACIDRFICERHRGVPIGRTAVDLKARAQRLTSESGGAHGVADATVPGAVRIQCRVVRIITAARCDHGVGHIEIIAIVRAVTCSGYNGVRRGAIDGTDFITDIRIVKVIPVVGVVDIATEPVVIPGFVLKHRIGRECPFSSLVAFYRDLQFVVHSIRHAPLEALTEVVVPVIEVAHFNHIGADLSDLIGIEIVVIEGV